MIRPIVSALLFPLALGAQGSPAPATPAPAGDVPVWAAKLDSAVLAELAKSGTPGAQIAIVVDGRVAYVKGYGVADAETKRPMTERTLMRVGSVSKMFTAAALNQLASAGTVDLNAPISRYVPSLAGKKAGVVTTHQLLTHSGGWLDNAIPYGMLDEAALGRVSGAVGDTLFFTEPGKVISYSNPGYSVAGYVAEAAGKAPFAELVDRLVLKKVGMPRATFRPLVAYGFDVSQGHVGQPSNPAVVVRPVTENTAQWPAGFLFASAGEIARFTIAMMNDGMLDGERVLASDAVKRMTTPHVVVPGADAGHYGHGLAVRMRDGRRLWSHGGAINGFDANVVMFPDQRVSVVIIDNRSGPSLPGIVDYAVELAAGIKRPAPPATPTALTLDAAARARIVGRYAQGQTRVEIVDDSGKLVFKQGIGRFPVQVMSDESIVITLPGTMGTRTLLLVRGADGQVAYLHQGLRALARQP